MAYRDKETVHFTVPMRRDLRKKVQEAARKEGRSGASQMRQLAIEWLTARGLWPVESEEAQHG